MTSKDILFADSGGSVELVGCAGSGLDLLDAAENGKRFSQQERDSAMDHCVLFFEIKAPMFVAKEHTAFPDWICREVVQDPHSLGFYEPIQYRKSSPHGFRQELINPVLRDDVHVAIFRVYRTSKAVKIHHQQALVLYKNMIDADICREQAATVLPQSVYVLYYASTTLADVFNFTNNVTDESLLPELRDVAASIFKVVAQRFPKTALAWRRAVKWKGDNVGGRLSKLGKLISAGERLNNEQSKKIKEIKIYLQNKGGVNSAGNEDNISQGERGTGSSQAPEKDRRRFRWNFWKKN